MLDRGGKSPITVSIKKHVRIASHSPDCGSSGSPSTPYISSKSPGSRRDQRRPKTKNDGECMQSPATSEKFEFGGNAEGETSGIVTALNKAGLSGMLERECMYG